MVSAIVRFGVWVGLAVQGVGVAPEKNGGDGVHGEGEEHALHVHRALRGETRDGIRRWCWCRD